MDTETIDRIARGLAAGMSRRRLGLLTAGLAIAPGAALAGKGKRKRCRKKLAACTKTAQCCGRGARCAASHGTGSNTCCGGERATCGSDQTCCIPLLCEGGRCLQPPA